MVIGFGCNVPSIMAARTLENPRDRLLTVMMSPFVSCGARLAIYAVFVAAFFPVGGQNIVFLLYLIGILMAVLTGFLLRRTLWRVSGSFADGAAAISCAWAGCIAASYLAAFAGICAACRPVIVPICLLLGALNTLNVDGTLNGGDGSVHSLLSAGGRLLTPVFAPIGLTPDNWPATVGLLTGVLRKKW